MSNVNTPTSRLHAQSQSRHSSSPSSGTVSTIAGHPTASLLKASVGRPSVITRPPFAQRDEIDIDNYEHAKGKIVGTVVKPIPMAPSVDPSEEKEMMAKQEAKREEEKRLTGDGAQERRESPDDHWWTFIRSTRVVQSLEGYLGTQEDSSDTPSDLEGQSEKHLTDKEDRDHLGRLDLPNRQYSDANMTQTPGWSTPWAPFTRTMSNPWFNNPHFGPSEGPLTGADAGHHNALTSSSYFVALQNFLLYSPFAPLWLRMINLSFTVAAMAVAAREWQIMKWNGIEGIIGQSVLFALIITPMTAVHVLMNVYLEYFGAPIGIWSIRTKMAHTLIELVFITFYAAELSIAFDDYFTTPAVCTAWTPNGQFRGTFGDSSISGSVTDMLCDLQVALVVLIFIGLMLYHAVLIVSLFRIFHKVNRKG